MSVPDVGVLRAEVFRAAPPVVVRVVLLGRDEPLQERSEVLEEARLELVDANAARRVRRVDAGDPVDDPAAFDGRDDVVGDVPDREPTGRPELLLLLEDLHARIMAFSTRSA